MSLAVVVIGTLRVKTPVLTAADSILNVCADDSLEMSKLIFSWKIYNFFFFLESRLLQIRMSFQLKP